VITLWSVTAIAPRPWSARGAQEHVGRVAQSPEWSVCMCRSDAIVRAADILLAISVAGVGCGASVSEA
jgi:hypothetical protein